MRYSQISSVLCGRPEFLRQNQKFKRPQRNGDHGLGEKGVHVQKSRSCCEQCREQWFSKAFSSPELLGILSRRELGTKEWRNGGQRRTESRLVPTWRPRASCEWTHRKKWRGKCSLERLISWFLELCCFCHLPLEYIMP